jgi:hypothetical protein
MAVKWYFEFAPDWRNEPMAYWVHVEDEDSPWLHASKFDPPAPKAITGKGFPILCVEIDDFLFRFSSPEQVEACIFTLSLKPLPSSLRLSAKRSHNVGPNSHWLSRLPASIKSPKHRDKAVISLKKAFQSALATDFGRKL